MLGLDDGTVSSGCSQSTPRDSALTSSDSTSENKVGIESEPEGMVWTPPGPAFFDVPSPDNREDTRKGRGVNVDPGEVETCRYAKNVSSDKLMVSTTENTLRAEGDRKVRDSGAESIVWEPSTPSFVNAHPSESKDNADDKDTGDQEIASQEDHASASPRDSGEGMVWTPPDDSFSSIPSSESDRRADTSEDPGLTVHDNDTETFGAKAMEAEWQPPKSSFFIDSSASTEISTESHGKTGYDPDLDTSHTVSRENDLHDASGDSEGSGAEDRGALWTPPDSSFFIKTAVSL
jgi:hypothetical protein